jgi:hypothetical protein
MGYTHVTGEDHRKVAEQLGDSLRKFASIFPRTKTAQEMEAPTPTKCNEIFGCGEWI